MVVTKFKMGDMALGISTLKNYFFVLILGAFTISIRFYSAFIVQGFDTPVYIYSSRLIDRGDLYVMLSATKPVPFLLSWVIFKISGNSILLTGFLLPYIFGFILLLLTVKAVKMGYNSDRLALIVGFITALSYYFIRVTYDLYAQTLGLGVLYITLITIARFYEASEEKFLEKTKEVVVSLLVLYVCHFYTAALVTMFFLIIFVLKIMKPRKEREFISTKRILLIIILSAFVSVSFIIIRWDYIVWLFTVVIPNEFRFLGVTLDSFWFLKQESLAFWVSVIIGFYVMIKRKTATDIILGLWGLFILILIFATGYVQTYRFLLLIPEAFYAGIGLEYTYTSLISGNAFLKFHKHANWSATKRKIFTFSIVFIFFGLLGINTLQRGYISQFVYYPNRTVESQLKTMEELFGFNNQNIIVPIFAPFSKNFVGSWTANIEGWSLAYLGTVIFRGSVLELISGVPNVYDNQYNEEKQRIILADKLYHLGPLEKYFSTEIYPGIYLFNATKKDVNWFITTNYVWFINSFNVSSVYFKDTINASISLNDNLSIDLPSGNHKGTTKIKFKGVGLYTTGFNTLIVNLSGNLEFTEVYVKLYFADGTCKYSKLDRIISEYTWRVIPILGDKFLTDIEITLVRRNSIIYPTEKIFISYLAIL